MTSDGLNLDSDERDNSLIFLRSIWVRLGRQNCVSKRGNVVIPNKENAINEYYEIVFEKFTILCESL